MVPPALVSGNRPCYRLDIMEAQPHPRQAERLNTLRRYAILDTPQEAEFDAIVALVAAICEAPVSVINLIDADRQWFKAEVGLGVRSTPLQTSLCSHVVLETGFVEIPDTLADPRMCDNPLCVADGGFRFYAGALLVADDGLPLGTLCVLDTKPRVLTALQRQTIEVMAAAVMRELNLRRVVAEQDVLRREVDHRVKNSLASIAAIIQLEARAQASAEAREALESVLKRLTALSALHEEMHDGEAGGDVAIAPLIDRAFTKLRLLVPARVTLAADVAAFSLPVAQASALALIVNEFVANSVKHGFADGREGRIAVQVANDTAGFALHCRDDGAGNDAALVRLEGSGGLGTRIITALSRSIGAEARWGSDGRGITLEVVAR